jgi:phenylalanyl-tRNA synthetase beta chain
MRFTLSWLKKHLKTEANLLQISETLTRIGLEVEEIIDKSKIYEPFIIAEIIEAIPHPNANKLQICKVNDGKQTLQVVCGAPNARAGIKVVLAPVGAMIPAGNFAIKAAKIRDVESNGMLCSREELLLDGDSSGIIELAPDALIGSKYASFASLDEVVIEVGLTPNRGDAASVYGIARDLAAAGIGELIAPEAANISYTNPYEVIIEDAENCQEFVATIINGVDNTKSGLVPINSLLTAIGSNPKSALVNISNFAMFDFGRPNHVYDLDKIKGAIKIRKSYEKELFIALGGAEYILPEGLLVVTDEEKILAIAGVMGGELSKVDGNTKNILVEVANFHPFAVAKAGRELNLLSDSRYRFERRIDSGFTDFFVTYLNKLIIESVGGSIIGSIKVRGKEIDYQKSIQFNIENVSDIAGCDISTIFTHNTLHNLGFKIDGKTVHIPSHRYGDITQNRDLVEEVLRIYGLDNLPTQLIPFSFEHTRFRRPLFTNRVRSYLTSQGFDEMITYAFVSHKYAEQFAFKNPVELQNPISAEMSVMRASQLPLLLENAAKNMTYGLLDASYFEIGNIFEGIEPEQQKLTISGICTGKHMRKTMFKEERDVDFYDIKAIIFALIELYGLNPDKCKITHGAPNYYHPGKSAVVSLGKNIIGYFGELNIMTLKAIDMEFGACAFELFISNMPELKAKSARSKLEISYLQAVTRDFAFIIDDRVEVGNMLSAVRGIDLESIESATVFDIYKGKSVEDGKKSVAFSITLRPQTETFTDAQIEAICQKVIALVQKDYDGVQR